MKKSIGKKTILYPHPLFIVGSYDTKGNPNIMAVSWGGICCSEPPSVAISVRKSRYSYDGIVLNKAFTINIPSTKYVNDADYAGKYSGRHVNKFEELNLTPVKSELINAPYIKEFPMAMICRVSKSLILGSHTQFIGEILDVLVDEEMLGSNGIPTVERVNPVIYDSGNHLYYAFGKKIFESGQGRSRKQDY